MTTQVFMLHGMSEVPAAWKEDLSRVFQNHANSEGLFHSGFDGSLKVIQINEDVTQRDSRVYIIPMKN